MTKVKLVKFEIKEGMGKTWKDWGAELKRREEEVIETLKDEGVVSESCFISGDGKSVYYFMEAADFEKVKNVAGISTHPIDAEHKQKRIESLKFAEELDVLFHFKNLPQ